VQLSPYHNHTDKCTSLFNSSCLFRRDLLVQFLALYSDICNASWNTAGRGTAVSVHWAAWSPRTGAPVLFTATRSTKWMRTSTVESGSHGPLPVHRNQCPCNYVPPQERQVRRARHDLIWSPLWQQAHPDYIASACSLLPDIQRHELCRACILDVIQVGMQGGGSNNREKNCWI
jgi:hypothetical protein